MKLTLAAVVALGSGALAFPPELFERGLGEEHLQLAARLMAQMAEEGDENLSRRQLFGSQPVSTSGIHEFIPPGPGDDRGPCPGLNALANHGYLPRNGVANLLQFFQATTSVYNMGPDIAAILAVYGGATSGDFISFSMGGDETRNFFGKPRGLSFTHNIFEVDASPTRGDFYSTGNGYKLQLENFKSLYDAPQGPNGYGLDQIADHAARRREHSKHTNPLFFSSPITVFVANTAHAFIPRILSNFSSENPGGYLDGNTLKSFFAIDGADSGSFIYREGHERIPDNWYHRSIPYTVIGLGADLAAMSLKHPSLLSLGGNTGKVDSFVGLDLADLTGGVFNVATLFSGNNLGCFAYRSAQDATPGLQNPGLQAMFTSFAGTLVSALGCPQMPRIDRNSLAKYPGAKGY
ncbi:hypothetical protein CDD81_586 [Ophiocordyceps australis]|uniref:Heme haloperoxidase family profile domain-containing protein n=1 Tax=Ophiocordyceps australis TaxID=1399860 RepID=A0A2C5YGP1_9HYPO|nr:hypothetical protein CDD81_586 [Ophiocordyceps australis]